MSPAQLSAKPPNFPEFLRPLKSVILVVLDRRGELVDANRGFHDLAAGLPANQDIRALFINPMLDEILNERGRVDGGQSIPGS